MSFQFHFQGAFQLYIEALDDDAFSDDHIEHIFINLDLEANSGPTLPGTYGDYVSLTMTFRVNCSTGFYGHDCTVHCQQMDDDTNGHFTCDPDDGSHICLPDYYGAHCLIFCQPFEFYTCDQGDGSLICNEGFTNPKNFCSESELQSFIIMGSYFVNVDMYSEY